VTRIVDVVNFNADASCLPAADWLAFLEGGESSRLCQWLRLYVDRRKPVALGFIGGALADMAQLNPESIALINAHRELFDIVLRPFSHDVGLLRSARGFEVNVDLGRRTLQREFGGAIEIYLPPEFMLTGAQVKLLADRGVRGVFLNPTRFRDERLPSRPYRVEGVLGSSLPCIPFRGGLTQSYLESLHAFDGQAWAIAVSQCGDERAFAWRDGESSFLLPDGLAREDAWLAGEPASIRRERLSDVLAALRFDEPSVTRGYPVHSFSAWFKEFRMMGFLSRLERIEARLDVLTLEERVVWLQAINSDVLSAVEKDSPIIKLRDSPGGFESPFTIWRSERGFEGEDYLALLEAGLDHLHSPGAHLHKLRARIEYVRRLT
jgi:hypothetical protein